MNTKQFYNILKVIFTIFVVTLKTFYIIMLEYFVQIYSHELFFKKVHLS